jgi:hypothetical protein
MGININKKTSFSVEGFLIARCNPDGTPLSPTRVLGFYGTVDLSAYAPHYKAYLGVKINNNAEQYQAVDFSAALDVSAVTVQEMVDAINAAGFTDITASVDTATGRLLIIYTGVGTCNFLQVFSVSNDPEFAAELDFGQGQTFNGQGARYFEAFDNTRTINLPKNIKDTEAIEKEAGDGSFIEVIIPGMVKGYNPVLTIKDDDYEIKQLIQSGEWIPATSIYTPSLTTQTRKPIFGIIMFVPKYGKGSHLKEDEDGYLRKDIFSMTGYEADTMYETKTLQEISYNCRATEYEDENDVKNRIIRIKH